MRDASGLFWVSFMVKAFLGDQRWNRWGRGRTGVGLFYLFTFKSPFRSAMMAWV